VVRNPLNISIILNEFLHNKMVDKVIHKKNKKVLDILVKKNILKLLQSTQGVKALS
jgi:hypothetical protein